MPRSAREISFRLRQELTNVRLLWFPPSLASEILSRTQSPCAKLPDPREVAAKLKHTEYAAGCIANAEAVLAHRFPLLGMIVTTGPDIRWRRDYVSGIESPADYFRRIPYLDAARVGDHKNIWELNRHQHLVLLAQAHLFTGRADFLDEIAGELESWFEQNPYQRGINWASALEVAFRALSWIWIWHLVGGQFNAPQRRRFLDGLYDHARHLAANLSFYFSPNTHLLGEAVALHAIAVLFPEFPESSEWRATGGRTVRAELDHQVQADGSHFEQSTYYHVYALDMFLFHAILEPVDAAYREKMERMAEFLDAVMGRSRRLPFFGDDDGGRLFHPYGDRDRFGGATLTAYGVFLNRPEWIGQGNSVDEIAAWWFGAGTVGRAAHGQYESHQFSASGLHVMVAGDIQLIADAGGFGPGSAGHSHADSLSLVLRKGDRQILIDPGTYTYVGDPVWRERFRGTSAHNTVRIDGMDQGTPGGPFGWRSRPRVRVTERKSSQESDYLRAECEYSGFVHQREIVFNKTELLIIIVDRISGDDGSHRLEQFWHFGDGADEAVFAFDPAVQLRTFEGEDNGWVSAALGAKLPARVTSAALTAKLPACLTAAIDISGKSKTLRFELNPEATSIICFRDRGSVSFSWAGGIH